MLIEGNEVVDESESQTNRKIQFTENSMSRTIEFDIAVSADIATGSESKTGLKVLNVFNAGGGII